MHAAADPLWTDYVAAFGTLVGILIAGAAAILAYRSGVDAKRSAESAGRTAEAASAISTASTATFEAASTHLELARAEHERLEAERGRRPVVDRLDLSDVQASPGEEAPPGLFRVAFKNAGDRELAAGVLTLLLDPGSAPELCDRWGNRGPGHEQDETRERWPGVEGLPLVFASLVRRVDAPPGVSTVTYVRVRRVGRFPVRVSLFSAALTGDGPWIDAWFEVNAANGVGTIHRLPNGRQHHCYEGRCVDFDQECGRP